MSTSIYKTNGQKFGWGPGVASLNPEKADLLKRFAQGKCLDIGFGSGVYTQHLQKLGHSVAGVDNENQFVQEAKVKYKKIKFLKASALNLPFKNLAFNTAIAFDILEHLDDQAALKETFRVAKRVIFSVPLKNQRILEQYGLSHAHYLDKTHLRVYSLKKIRSLAKSLNLKLVYLEKSLPLSISGLLINRLSQKNKFLKIILKVLLKPFLPEPPLYSTIFGVIERKSSAK